MASKIELFLSLARPDSEGHSRWVSVGEFVGDFASLALGNGGSWCRANSTLAKKYKIEFDKSLSPGNAIDRIRLGGFNDAPVFSQAIRADIRDFYKNKNCVMLGIHGSSENTKIEIDHKNGRKNDSKISSLKTQSVDDFQPLCKAANDAKRQICKKCKETNKRWSAKNILGNPYDFYAGGEDYTEGLGCIGCYQYDPVAYRRESVRRLIRETSEELVKKIYGEG